MVTGVRLVVRTIELCVSYPCVRFPVLKWKISISAWGLSLRVLPQGASELLGGHGVLKSSGEHGERKLKLTPVLSPTIKSNVSVRKNLMDANEVKKSSEVDYVTDKVQIGLNLCSEVPVRGHT
jgi:hypothetical protein